MASFLEIFDSSDVLVEAPTQDTFKPRSKFESVNPIGNVGKMMGDQIKSKENIGARLRNSIQGVAENPLGAAMMASDKIFARGTEKVKKHTGGKKISPPDVSGHAFISLTLQQYNNRVRDLDDDLANKQKLVNGLSISTGIKGNMTGVIDPKTFRVLEVLLYDCINGGRVIFVCGTRNQMTEEYYVG